MKMKSATWLNACQLAGAERGAVVLRCGGYSRCTSFRQPTGGGPAGNDLVLRPPAAETAAAPPGSARAAHAAEDSRSTPRLDSAMGGSISSRCSTRAAPRHAGPAGREPGLYLVSAALRAVAAVPRPARADLPGAPWTSRRCRLRRPRVRRRALGSSRCSTRAAPRHAGPAGREPGLYLVSAALRAVAAVPRPARADLPGAPRTSRRCRLRRPRVRRRALKSSLDLDSAAAPGKQLDQLVASRHRSTFILYSATPPLGLVVPPCSFHEVVRLGCPRCPPSR